MPDEHGRQQILTIKTAGMRKNKRIEQEAIDRKHLHITDLQPYFERFKETKFILIHFSSRYTLEEIKTYQSIWENMCGNVKFFISNIVNPNIVNPNIVNPNIVNPSKP